MATFVYLIFTFFFEHFLKGIKDLRCRMVTFFYFISTFFCKHFLPGIIGLRCRMVTCFYLSFTFFFEHFLQGTMSVGCFFSILPLPSFSSTFCKELWTSDIGWLHPHKDTSQTVYKLLADIYQFLLPSPPIRRVRGGNGGGTGWHICIMDFGPPPQKCKSVRAWCLFLDLEGGLTFKQPSPRVFSRRGQNCSLHFVYVPLAYTPRKGWWYSKHFHQMAKVFV